MSYGEETEPLAIAHRGGAALGPENTLAAFAMSTALCLRYLESDVRLTADGHLVCFHDDTLDPEVVAPDLLDQSSVVDALHPDAARPGRAGAQTLDLPRPGGRDRGPATGGRDRLAQGHR